MIVRICGLILSFALVWSAAAADAPSTIVDPSFQAEGSAGALSAWRNCGTVPPKLESEVAVRGKRWALALGSASGGEIAGDAAVCQQIRVPMARSVMLDYWAQSASTEPDTSHAYQQVALYDGDTSPDMTQPYAVLVHSAVTTSGFTHYIFDITQFAGQTLYLSFGVHGDGNPAAHTSMIVGNVSLQVDSPIHADSRQ